MFHALLNFIFGTIRKVKQYFNVQLKKTKNVQQFSLEAHRLLRQVNVGLFIIHVLHDMDAVQI